MMSVHSQITSNNITKITGKLDDVHEMNTFAHLIERFEYISTENLVGGINYYVGLPVLGTDGKRFHKLQNP